MDSIFIQIVAYRDLELIPTVEEAIAHAAHPEGLSFGICWQYGTDKEKNYISKLKAIKNCRIIALTASQACGVGWARSLVQKLWEKERYTLQIDAHMRFLPGWDVELIKMLKRCPSEKPLLSTYPPAYRPPRELVGDTPSRLEPDKFRDPGTLTLRGIGDLSKCSTPQLGAFVAAGFIFAEGSIIEEVPYDPDIYFTGEEVLFAAKAWTRGWDIYHPNLSVCWHFYNTGKKRVVHWEDHKDWWVQNQISESRFRQILGMETAKEDFGIYGLGNVRSLAEYEAFAGVNFQERWFIRFI
jgi:hypothetical protein